MRVALDKRLKGSVLPVVIVISMLMVIGVLFLITVWEMETFMFNRNNRLKALRANVESGFILYSNHPEILEGDSRRILQIHESDDRSEVEIERQLWGLYEAVVIRSVSGNMSQIRLLGLKDNEAYNFYYSNNGSSLTVTGNTNIIGKSKLPKNGMIYGQMKSIFFSGEKLSPEMISVSDEDMSPVLEEAKLQTDYLLSLIDQRYPTLIADSMMNKFDESDPRIFYVANEGLRYKKLHGKIIIVGDQIVIDSTVYLNDVVVVGNNVRIKKGFIGSTQIFAKDSVNIENNVALDYPSGIYSSNYAEIGDDSSVNGYVIVDADNDNIRKANFKQSRYAATRGLLYVKGNSQLQGIVSGKAVLSRAVYYSPEGYYKDMIYDASILQNDYMPLPVWLEGDKNRQFVKWLY